ncbi:GHMP kinase [Seonamhaeicola sp. S2-3]|uniref:GYDIA family GHMP kinase n=1 Tax=Seonamhaeicola sp. S2-3 TaxID=1936081 RepID=UPI000972BE83|nr:GYDIA family GHMP kinase [Seonamhaeicola sp. S2-3]APY10220.1 GHMP kinase [Seonamhaeicola sp. S2-3]
MQKFYSHGKLLLTGEYVVLDGAVSLAIPTKYGQSLNLDLIDKPIVIWESFDENGHLWFKGEFEINNEKVLKPIQNNDVSERITQILNACKQLNPEFLNSEKGYKITTSLDFPKNWGLGTSSTLINNMAQWTKVDAFKLLELTFGGSGYDIACAQNNHPITYKLENKTPVIDKAAFNPSFKEHLYFVHLNKKQNSREGIAYYKTQNKNRIKEVISDINAITSKMITCNSLEEFNVLINKHESIIADITKQRTVKELLFNDFGGSVKSLGAWGGDFVLASSKNNPTNYFKNKGFHTIIPYLKMVL